MNKLLRSIISVSVLLIIAGTIAILRPWQYISFLPVFNSGTALTVNISQGKGEVFLDGTKVGETPFSSENLTSGDHELEIHRISAQTDFYSTISRQIHLEPNTRTFLEAEIGPDPQFSSYILMYYTKNTNSSASLYINTLPKNTTISIDDQSYGTAPVAADSVTPGRHTLAITHEGYESKDTVIIAREGYTLVVEVQLMAKPIEISTP